MDDRNPASDRLRRLASRYEAAVGRGRAEHIAARAMNRAHQRSSVGRRLAVAVSTGAFTLVSMTGVGVAADRAVPGDFLYPLDRALESVGLTSDLVEERLLEAITLAERGDMVLAVQTANEALDELSRRGVTATLPAVTQELAAPTTESADGPATTTTEGQVVADTTTLPTPTDTQVPGDALTSDEPQPADAPGTTVEVAEPVDAGATLRLAAEQLLQSVRSAKTDPSTSGGVTTAALFLAETTAGASSNEVSPASTTSTTSSTSTSTTTSSTSTTSTTSTTTTTVPDESAPGNGNDQNSGTTTTTVASDPDDGSGSNDSTGEGEDDSPGPIFLPTP